MKILLIDDEEQDDLIEVAQEMGMEVQHEKIVSVGLECLSKSYWEFDAVILDAWGKINHESAQPDTTALYRSLAVVRKLNQEHAEEKPYCVWTGYPKDVKDLDVKCFDKAAGSTRVLEYLRGILKNLPSYAVKLNYREAFEACRTAGLDDTSMEHIQAIFRSLHGRKETLSQDYPKHLRTALECMFRKAHSLGLLDDHCLPNGRVNLAWSTKYMCGGTIIIPKSGSGHNEIKVWYTVQQSPELIKHHLHFILDSTNPLSHSENPTRNSNEYKVHEYLRNMPHNYLLYSLTFHLLDVLLWFKGYADAHPDVNRNKGKRLTR